MSSFACTANRDSSMHLSGNGTGLPIQLRRTLLWMHTCTACGNGTLGCQMQQSSSAANGLRPAGKLWPVILRRLHEIHRFRTCRRDRTEATGEYFAETRNQRTAFSIIDAAARPILDPYSVRVRCAKVARMVPSINWRSLVLCCLSTRRT